MKTLWDKLVEGLGYDIQPSPQQQAIWKVMELSAGKVQTIQFTAFNKSIVADFENKWGWLVQELRSIGVSLAFSTMHSLGFKAVQRAFGKVQVNSYRVQDIISELLEKDIRDLRRSKPVVIKAVEDLVGLCKMNLIYAQLDSEDVLRKAAIESQIGFKETTQEITCSLFDLLKASFYPSKLAELASYYDVDLNGNSDEVFDLVPRVLERCKDIRRDGCIDFNDMIWLPVILHLPVYKYDLLLVDECQDLSRVQQALAKMTGQRLIMVGDSKQAIYGFAGADAESMKRMEQELSATDRGCLHLPLTVTRRCGKAIVKEAQKIVPEFSAHETNPEGKVSSRKFKADNDGTGSYHRVVQDGDMILSRVNAPLVSECFRFIKAGRKANIQGRDIGAGLVKTIAKLCKPLEPEFVAIPTLIQGLSDWLYKEQAKEQAKRNPNDAKLINLQDRHDCLLCFTEGCETAQQMIRKVEQVFTDDHGNGGIRLSSIHKAKGLEAKRVFFIRTAEAPCPHPMSRSDWEKQGEQNLLYVGITRAIEELIWVS